MIFDLFSRGPRVRVSGILVRDDALLLIAHKKRGDIYWLLPGGGVQFGESLDQALAREFREELGIGVAVGPFEFMCDSIKPHGRRHILNISFGCEYRDGEYRLGTDRRLHSFGFFTAPEIPAARIYPPINQVLVSILEKRRHNAYVECIWRD